MIKGTLLNIHTKVQEVFFEFLNISFKFNCKFSCMFYAIRKKFFFNILGVGALYVRRRPRVRLEA